MSDGGVKRALFWDDKAFNSCLLLTSTNFDDAVRSGPRMSLNWNQFILKLEERLSFRLLSFNNRY